MPKALKRSPRTHLLKIDRTTWEFWLFVLSLVTILGFFVQSHEQPDRDVNLFFSDSKGEAYDIRVPNNNRVVQDRLETGR